MNIGQLTAILQVNAAQLNLAAGALKKFETEANTSLNKVQLGLDKASASMKTFGTAMSIGLTLPIAGLGVIATKTFREYELNLAHIIGLTGTSREQTMQWSSQLMELAKATAQGPTKLADALYFIASSGIEDAKAMDVLTVSAKAAAAGLGEVNAIADLTTSALNAYKGTGLTAAQVTDQLTAAVREGKAEAPGFAEAIGYAIPIAAQLGVTFDQVAAAMAAVSGVGVDVNTAALYLRQVLSDLLKPSHQAEQALNDMGTSSAKLREELANKGLLPLLRTLSDLTAKNGKTMASVFPEVRSLTEVLALTGKNVEHVADIFDLVANSTGDMGKALQPVTETLDFQFKEALANSQIALIGLGEALKGPVSDALNWISGAIQDVTKWFSSFSSENQKTIIQLGLLAAAAGPVLLIVSSLIKVFQGLSLAFSASPFGILAAAIGLTVTTLSFFLNRTRDADRAMSSSKLSGTQYNRMLKDQEQNIKMTNVAIDERIKKLKSLNLEQLKALKSDIQQQITIAQNVINPPDKQVLAAFKKSREELKAKLAAEPTLTLADMGFDQDSIDKINFSNIIKKIDVFSATTQQKITDATERFNKLTEQLKVTDKALQDAASNQVDASGFSKAQEVIKGVEKDIENLNKIIASGDTVTDSAKEKVDIYTKGLKALSETTDVTNAQMVKMQDNLKQAFSDEVIANYIQTVEGLNAKMNAFGYTEELLEEALKAVNKALDELYSKGIATGAAIDYLKYAFQNTKPPIEKVSEALDKMIASQIEAKNYSKKLGDEVDTTTSKIGAFSSALDAASGNNFASGIMELSNSFDNLKEKYGSIWDAGASKSEETLKDVANFATNFVSVIQMMKDAVIGQFMDISNGVLDVINSLSGYVRQIKQNALDYAQSVADDQEERIRQIAESENKSQKWLSQQLTANQKQLAANQDAINKEYGEKLKRYALLAAKINIAQGITKVLAEKGILGIGQAALIYEAGRIQVKTIEAQQFAKGGIVPPGYSGDTYPALLSSGEMVTPPGKLPQMASTNIEVTVKGDWEISGEKLRYVLKETESRILNSY